MKRSCIGNIKIDTDKYMLSVNRDFSQMRQSQVRIYSYLDLLQERAALTDETQTIYNDMDKYYCMFCIIEQFGSNVLLLENSLYYLSDEVEKGSFDKIFKTLEERNANLQRTTDRIINNCLNNVGITAIVDEESLKWWTENIINLNFYENDFKRTTSAQSTVTISGMTDQEFIEDFKKSGVAWSYLRCNKDIIKNNKKALLKYNNQVAMSKYLASCNIKLDQVTQRNLIDSGILKETGSNADNCVLALKAKANQKSNIGDPTGVSELIMAIVTILSTCIGVVATIFQVVRNAKQSDLQAQQLTPDNMMSETDWFGFLDQDMDGMIDLKWLFLLGGLFAIGAYYLN